MTLLIPTAPTPGGGDIGGGGGGTWKGRVGSLWPFWNMLGVCGGGRGIAFGPERVVGRESGAQPKGGEEGKPLAVRARGRDPGVNGERKDCCEAMLWFWKGEDELSDESDEGMTLETTDETVERSTVARLAVGPTRKGCVPTFRRELLEFGFVSRLVLVVAKVEEPAVVRKPHVPPRHRLEVFFGRIAPRRCVDRKPRALEEAPDPLLFNKLHSLGLELFPDMAWSSQRE